MERHLDKQLAKLRNRIIKMCSLIDEQTEYMVRSIEEENAELARLAIEMDSKVNNFDVKIDKICQRIFALNQPVAMDLRLIMSALTINNNLERIGDISSDIASRFLMLKSKPDFYGQTKFHEMATVVMEMIKNAIDSFIEMDPDLAKKVIDANRTLIRLDQDNYNIIIELMKEKRADIDGGVALLVMSRLLQRMGDHATNIAEDIYFIVEAQMIKHNYEKYLFSQEDDDDDGDDA